jgi:hypothetical protein
MTEAKFHNTVAAWLTVVLTPASWFTTIPLGGGGFVRGAKLKRAGAKKGTPDILIVHDGRAYFAELKSPKGRLKPEQAETIVSLMAAGCQVQVWRSLDDAKASLQAWGIPTRLCREQPLGTKGHRTSASGRTSSTSDSSAIDREQQKEAA